MYCGQPLPEAPTVVEPPPKPAYSRPASAPQETSADTPPARPPAPPPPPPAYSYRQPQIPPPAAVAAQPAPYPYPAPYPAPRRRSGLATASLVCGIFGLILVCVPGFGLLLSLLAVPFGLFGLLVATRPTRYGTGRALTGLILGSSGLVLGGALYYLAWQTYNERSALADLGWNAGLIVTDHGRTRSEVMLAAANVSSGGTVAQYAEFARVVQEARQRAGDNLARAQGLKAPPKYANLKANLVALTQTDVDILDRLLPLALSLAASGGNPAQTGALQRQLADIQQQLDQQDQRLNQIATDSEQLVGDLVAPIPGPKFAPTPAATR